MLKFIFGKLSGKKKRESETGQKRRRELVTYVDGDSILHQLDPRTKFFMVLLLSCVSLFTEELVPMALLFISIMALAAVSGMFKYWLHVMRRIAPLLLMIIVVNMFFSKGSYGQVFFSADLWMLHPQITFGGILYSAAMGFRLLTFVGISMLFIMSTKYEDFVKGLRKFRIPYVVCFSLGLALRSTTYLSSDVRNIMDAQRSRCLEFDRGSVLKNYGKFLSLFIPMTVSLLKRSRTVSEAMQCRGFGYTKHPTMYKELRFGRCDYIVVPLVIVFIIALLFLAIPAQAAEPTTDVVVVKYASDNTTILNDTMVTYGWMEANLPVQGDGVTHYYHQGPLFGEKFENDPWDVNETTNIESRDFGAVKGTDVRDLCELVGGMSPGERVMIRASDGFRKYFDYANVYEPLSRQGPMVLTWWRADDGYVPDYSTGMRLVFFADDHVFGHWDMHECIAPEYWYNYTDRDGGHPSSGGLSVKNVDEIAIYSMMDPPELRSIEVSPASVTLDIGYEQRFTATGYDQYADEMPDIVFTWTSSDETVGTVDDTGLFTALAAGETVITAKKEGVQGTASVTVSSPAPTASPSPSPTPSQVLTTLTISPAAATLNVGEAQQFTGVAYDQDHREMSDIVFVWTSSDKAVGTIDASGLFTAYGAGDATVTAENDGVIGLAGVTVDLPTPAPASTKAETQPEDLTPSQSSVPAPYPSPLPPTTSPAPKATPNSSGFKTPGFAAMFAITGLLMASCLIRRRKV